MGLFFKKDVYQKIQDEINLIKIDEKIVTAEVHDLEDLKKKLESAYNILIHEKHQKNQKEVAKAATHTLTLANKVMEKLNHEMVEENQKVWVRIWDHYKKINDEKMKHEYGLVAKLFKLRTRLWTFISHSLKSSEDDFKSGYYDKGLKELKAVIEQLPKLIELEKRELHAEHFLETDLASKSHEIKEHAKKWGPNPPKEIGDLTSFLN